MQVAASGVAVLMNTSLMRYGCDLAVGAYGIFNTIMMLLLMSVMGLNQYSPLSGTTTVHVILSECAKPSTTPPR